MEPRRIPKAFYPLDRQADEDVVKSEQFYGDPEMTVHSGEIDCFSGADEAIEQQTTNGKCEDRDDES